MDVGKQLKNRRRGDGKLETSSKKEIGRNSNRVEDGITGKGNGPSQGKGRNENFKTNRISRKKEWASGNGKRREASGVSDKGEIMARR